MPSAQTNASVKSKVLIYSDCAFFAGCENMPANLVNDPGMGREFQVVFAYRYSARYYAGAKARIDPAARTLPLHMPAIETVLEKARRARLPFLRPVLRFSGLLVVLKYAFALYAAIELFFVFRRIRPDILHINNGGYPGAYSCVAAVFAARAAGIRRIVFVVNSIAVPYKGLLRRLEKPIDKSVGRKVSFFVTGSGYAGERLRELLKLPPEKFLRIPNGIAPRPEKETPEYVRRRLGINDGAIVLGNVAILEPRKGHKYLLEALALIREKFESFSRIVLVVEGAGSQKEHLERQAGELGLEKNLIFLSGEKNVFDLMRIFDVFVLPSVGYEDFPNVILEAMSLGKPVVGTRVAGIPEQVLDGETGFIVEPANPDALACAILRLLSDERLRAAMGAKSLERFKTLFSYEKSIGSYVDLYRSMMAV